MEQIAASARKRRIASHTNTVGTAASGCTSMLLSDSGIALTIKIPVAQGTRNGLQVNWELGWALHNATS
jgi:hypothetical protein